MPEKSLGLTKRAGWAIFTPKRTAAWKKTRSGEAEVRALYARWDQRDPDVMRLWEQTRLWSLEGFDQIYSLLGVRFDKIYYDHEMEKPGQELVDDLIRQRDRHR